MRSIPITRTRELVVQPFRRTDDHLHPEIVRPWGGIGPVVGEDDSTIGVSVVVPRWAVAVYVYPREGFR